jgi:hypothetical protein
MLFVGLWEHSFFAVLGDCVKAEEGHGPRVKGVSSWRSWGSVDQRLPAKGLCEEQMLVTITG